jgi:outer membrane protein TolC
MRMTLAALLVAGLLSCAAQEVRLPVMSPWLPGATSRVAAGMQQDDAAVNLPLSLESIVTLAGQRPLGIAAARARAAEALAGEDVANSQWLPILHTRVSLVRHQDRLQDTVGTLRDVDKQNAFGGGGIGLEFNPARAYYDSLVAAQNSRAAELGIRSAQHFNVEAAVRFYYDLLQSAASLQITEQTELQAIELLRVQKSARSVGGNLEADVLRAEAFLAGARGRVARAKASMEQANARLSGLLVLPDATQLIPMDQTVAPIDFGEAELGLPVLLERASARRPDLEQGRARLAAAGSERARESWSWLVPGLRLGSEYGTYGAALSRGKGRKDFFADIEWRVGFGTPARARFADARLLQAELGVQRQALQLQTDLRIGIAEVRATASQMSASRQEVAAASAALKLVKLRNREGRVLLLEVLDAERVATQARIGLVEAICAHNRAQFGLHRLVGGPEQVDKR